MIEIIFFVLSGILTIILAICAVSVRKMKETATTMKNERDTLKTENEELKESIEQLQSVNTELLSSNNQLNTSLEGLEKDKKQLDEENKRILGNFKIVQSLAEDRHKELEILKTESGMTIKQLRGQLVDATQQIEEISLENASMSVDILKMKKRVEDVESRLTPAIIGNFSTTELSIARIEALHKEDVNGQLNAVIPSIKKMKEKVFVTTDERARFTERIAVLENSSFVKRASYSGFGYNAIKYTVLFITQELIDFVRDKEIGVKISYNILGKKEVIDIKSWFTKEGYFWGAKAEGFLIDPRGLSETKKQLYRYFGYDNMMYLHSPTVKRINIAENYGDDLKSNPVFNERFNYQLPYILEEDVTDISLILYYNDNE